MFFEISLAAVPQRLNPKPVLARRRGRPRGEGGHLYGFQIPLHTISCLDAFRAKRGWSCSLAVRSLLDAALAAELGPDFMPASPQEPQTPRRRGRPAPPASPRTGCPSDYRSSAGTLTTPRCCGRRLPMKLQRRGRLSGHPCWRRWDCSAFDAFPVARRLAPRAQSISAATAC